MELKLIGGFAISLCIVLLCMPKLIVYLKKISCKQTNSEYLPDSYKERNDIPIMGGTLFILTTVLVPIFLMPHILANSYMLLIYLTFIGYGLIGFCDDFLIAVKKNNDGLSAKKKFLMQIILATILFFIFKNDASLSVYLPFSHRTWNMGNGYIVLMLLMFAGSSNAVNLTDGMDGLSSGCVIISLVPFLLLAIQAGKFDIALFVVCLMGTLFGYLYYNKKPARIFMGDTGSLALGAVLASLAMALQKEIALIFIGGIFVIETLCVMIQITSVKTRHKKVFPYTPIHYAFVLKGMEDKKVVHMFYLVELVLATIGYFVACM